MPEYIRMKGGDWFGIVDNDSVQSMTESLEEHTITVDEGGAVFFPV